MLKKLKAEVFQANLDLIKNELVMFTWGNVSGINREKGLVVIKPSGVHYDAMKPDDMVVVDMDGKVVEGELRPSSDTETHLELYRSFKNVGGIVHTHSEWATGWAQAGSAIPPLGTTHADYFDGEIPCTRGLTEEEVSGDYELETGKVIVETFRELNPDTVPAVLVKSHGPFCWGTSPADALQNALFLETIARMAFRTIVLGNNMPIDQFLLDKHYWRKHGKKAYYGQK